MDYISFNALVTDESYNKIADIFVKLDQNMDIISFNNDSLFFDEENVDINTFCVNLFESFIFMCDESIIKNLSKYVEKYIENNNIKYIYDNRNNLLKGFFLVDDKLAKSSVRFSKKLGYKDNNKSEVTYNLSEFLTYTFYIYFVEKSKVKNYKYNFIPYCGGLKTSDEMIKSLKLIRNE